MKTKQLILILLLFASCQSAHVEKKKTEVMIKTLKKDSPFYDYQIDHIEILGSNKNAEFEVRKKGLVIRIPSDLVVSDYATTFKIVGGDLMYTDLAR